MTILETLDELQQLQRRLRIIATLLKKAEELTAEFESGQKDQISAIVRLSYANKCIKLAYKMAIRPTK